MRFPFGWTDPDEQDPRQIESLHPAWIRRSLSIVSRGGFAMKLSAAALAAFLVVCASEAGAQQGLAREPPRGALRPGESIYAESKRCPKGQVMLVTGGRLSGGGVRMSGDQGQRRQRSCVPRP